MDSEVTIKQIVLDRMERCAVCHREFHADDIHVISRKPDMWTMMVECTDCHARNFVAAVMNDGDPAEAQLALRRLSERAIRSLQEAGDSPTHRESPPQGPPVAAGDVVDMHEFLQAFDGDFTRLFSKG